MTREQIEQWARECALDTDELAVHQLSRFAALVAAHEREQCALVCEKQELEFWNSPEEEHWTPHDCAAAIRARGEVTPSQ